VIQKRDELTAGMGNILIICSDSYVAVERHHHWEFSVHSAPLRDTMYWIAEQFE
jgi:hypothetical protein